MGSSLVTMNLVPRTSAATVPAPSLRERLDSIPTVMRSLSFSDGISDAIVYAAEELFPNTEPFAIYPISISLSAPLNKREVIFASAHQGQIAAAHYLELLSEDSEERTPFGSLVRYSLNKKSGIVSCFYVSRESNDPKKLQLSDGGIRRATAETPRAQSVMFVPIGNDQAIQAMIVLISLASTFTREDIIVATNLAKALRGPILRESTVHYVPDLSQ